MWLTSARQDCLVSKLLDGRRWIVSLNYLVVGCGNWWLILTQQTWRLIYLGQCSYTMQSTLLSGTGTSSENITLEKHFLAFCLFIWIHQKLIQSQHSTVCNPGFVNSINVQKRILLKHAGCLIISYWKHIAHYSIL